MNVTQTTVNVFQELLHLLIFKSTKSLQVFHNKEQLLRFFPTMHFVPVHRSFKISYLSIIFGQAKNLVKAKKHDFISILYLWLLYAEFSS